MAQCTATAKGSSERCRRRAHPGATVCVKHGAGAPQTRAKADVRHAVATWLPGAEVADPGETLLRLLTIALLRADQHRAELDALVTAHGWHGAFVGEQLVVTDSESGATRKVGEYARHLAQWEARERHEAAELAVKAVAAGLAERQIRVLEQQVSVFSEALRVAVVTAGLSPEQQSEVIVGVSRELRAVAG